MSVITEPRPLQPFEAGARLLIALALVGAVAGLFALLLAWLAPTAPPPPARNPFGVGPREAAPAATGLGGLILAYQAQFYRALTAALRALQESWATLPTLMGLGFAYGVIHAAGPGHGKAVISAYILSDDHAAVRRGFALSLGAALVQALFAIGLVALFNLILGATARQMNDATRWLELASFAALALMGLALLWVKAGVLIAAWRGESAACAPGCGHTTLSAPPPARDWRETLGVVLVAGSRPCAGAIIVLVFAASQGLIAAGVATTFAMALGTALTTGGLAMLAVGAKRVALGLAAGRGQGAALTVRLLEGLAAAAVAVLGLSLLFGYLGMGGQS
jgi:ABC-type nickel/cobalt efflux system permease component RcnA